MSYICKGNIPKNCSKCPQRTLYHGINVCLAADKMKVSTSNKSRHENCPLVEIPTLHGRLIDADELIGYLNEWLSDSVALFGFTRIINHQPIIIEAEVNE